MERKLILISNDDGCGAQGIGELTEWMLSLGDVIVVAPDSARSGAACSITPTLPVSIESVRKETRSNGHELQVWACTGSPVDCVKLGMEQICPRKPDLMVSGINHGDNASCSVHYSGTMGAVIESCLKGIPSIGYSLRTLSHQCDFLPYRDTTIRIAQFVLEHGLPIDVCLNVNYPEVANLQGLRVCRLARGIWNHEWISAQNPRGTDAYWLTGKFSNLEPSSEDTDYWALDHGFAAITPITIDMTAYAAIGGLKSLEK